MNVNSIIIKKRDIMLINGKKIFNKKKIEINEDIEEMINNGEFILVYTLENFEMISSDEEIFIETKT